MHGEVSNRPDSKQNANNDNFSHSFQSAILLNSNFSHHLMAPSTCCSETVMQSSVLAYQNTNTETSTVKSREQGAQNLAQVICLGFKQLPIPVNLLEPVMAPRNTDDPRLPYYKLYRRLTYYG